MGTWDGRRYTLAPGKNAFPETMALKFKEQNPIMGSEDPYSLEKQYLCGIEEFNDDCSPAEQTDAVERFDRSKLTNAKPVELITNGGLLPNERHAALPAVDQGFVKA
jgi:hypothetical protein